MHVTRTQDLITKRKLHSFDCFFTSLNYHHEKCVQTSNRNFTLDRPRVHWDHYRQRWKELSTPLVVWLRKESKYYETCSQGCQNKPATGAFSKPEPRIPSSAWFIARDVKEPTHLSQRVGNVAPGVVVWPVYWKLEASIISLHLSVVNCCKQQSGKVPRPVL